MSCLNKKEGFLVLISILKICNPQMIEILKSKMITLSIDDLLMLLEETEDNPIAQEIILESLKLKFQNNNYMEWFGLFKKTKNPSLQQVLTEALREHGKTGIKKLLGLIKNTNSTTVLDILLEMLKKKLLKKESSALFILLGKQENLSVRQAITEVIVLREDISVERILSLFNDGYFGQQLVIVQALASRNNLTTDEYLLILEKETKYSEVQKIIAKIIEPKLEEIIRLL